VRLNRLILHGTPRYLHSDNCPEFVSRAILKWTAQHGMDMAPSDPGKPRQNGADESFNGKFRDECVSVEGSAHGSKPNS
jgi:putative transposase